jgi:hypothetical protein
MKDAVGVASSGTPFADLITDLPRGSGAREPRLGYPSLIHLLFIAEDQRHQSRHILREITFIVI